MSSKRRKPDEKQKAGKKRAQLKQESEGEEEGSVVCWSLHGSKVIKTTNITNKDESKRFTHTELCPRCKIIDNLTVPHAQNCVHNYLGATRPIYHWICPGCVPKPPPISAGSTTQPRVQSTDNMLNEIDGSLLDQNDEELDAELSMSDVGDSAGV